MILKFRHNKELDLTKPHIMGILNITPDSFSDGGKFLSKDQALEQAATMLEEGASIIDVGGESARPGALAVSDNEQLDRIAPIVENIAQNFNAIISIDTSSPIVIKECVSLGAHLWNDIRALSVEGALECAVNLQIPVCLMHMQGQPHNMQDKPHYDNVVNEVYNFLLNKAQLLEKSGLSQEKILLDPGFGFGKSVNENYQLLKHLDKLTQSPYAVLTGLSRKSMIGAINHEENAQNRLIGSVTGALLCAMKGAKILRVHDCKETKQALEIYEAMELA